MALSRTAQRGFDWNLPTWTDDEGARRAVNVGYNPYADELVIRFANAAGKVAIVEPIETPDDHYANVMADEATGEVIGVQIDHLRAAALAHFPDWAAAADPDPTPAVIDRVVRGVHDLFVRYGVGGLVWNGQALVRDR